VEQACRKAHVSLPHAPAVQAWGASIHPCQCITLPLITYTSKPVTETATELVTPIPLVLLDPNPFQPRERFDAAAIEELAASIREQGVLQPVIVRWVGERYELIAGERRLRACRYLGLDSIPAIVREYTDEQALEVAIVENLQRADISIVETARAYLRLAEAFHYSQGEIALRTGKSRAAISNTLRLLQLPPAVLALLDEGELTEGHARALLGLPYPSLQEELADWVVRNGAAVREVEGKVRELTGRPSTTPPASGPPSRRDLHVRDLEEQLRRVFGTRVTLDYRSGRGSLRLEFYSDDDLQRILEIVGLPDAYQ
jgi:ParB family transcriptional regulator, chromosome partitioning protein